MSKKHKLQKQVLQLPTSCLFGTLNSILIFPFEKLSQYGGMVWNMSKISNMECPKATQITLFVMV